MRTFLIDTDTASDDSVAILMALAAPDVRVAALTIVAGNVSAAQAARNALLTCEIAGADVPVYLGADAPLMRRHLDAHWFHGKDGMGDRNYPAPRRAVDPGHAVDVLIAQAAADPQAPDPADRQDPSPAAQAEAKRPGPEDPSQPRATRARLT